MDAFINFHAKKRSARDRKIQKRNNIGDKNIGRRKNSCHCMLMSDALMDTTEHGRASTVANADDG